MTLITREPTEILLPRVLLFWEPAPPASLFRESYPDPCPAPNFHTQDPRAPPQASPWYSWQGWVGWVS